VQYRAPATSPAQAIDYGPFPVNQGGLILLAALGLFGPLAIFIGTFVGTLTTGPLRGASVHADAARRLRELLGLHDSPPPG